MDVITYSKMTQLGNEVSEVKSDFEAFSIEGDVIIPEFESGSMFDATGIEYVDPSKCRTKFIPIVPDDEFYVLYDEAVLNGPQIFFFTANTKTASGSNERIARWSAHKNSWYGAVQGTKYMRIAINNAVANVVGHVYVVKKSKAHRTFDSLAGRELDIFSKTGYTLLHGVFVNQGASNGVIIGSAPWRASSVTKFVFDHDVTLIPDEGYQYGVHLFGSTGESFVSGTPWMTVPYSVPANTYFRVTIQQTASLSGVVDLEDNVKGIKVDHGGMSKKADDIQRIVSGDSAVFTDGGNGKRIDNFIISFMPSQTGSGEPSKDNVRTISGYTGLTIKQSGADTSTPAETEVSWSTEAGTVFGGTYNPTTGILTKTYQECVFDGSETPSVISQSGDTIRFWMGKGGIKFYGSENVYCDQMVVGKYDDRIPYTYGMPNEYPTNVFMCVPYGGADGVQSADAAGIKAWLATHPIQFVTQLSTPAVYQLTRHVMLSLPGENHIWSTVGVVDECKYRCDSTLYANQSSRIPLNLKKYTYDGERIAIQKHVASEFLFDLTWEYPIIGDDNKNRTRQGGTAYGDYLFVGYNGMENISVYDLRTGSHVYNIPISETYQTNFHCNNMNFGYEKYDPADEFPLLYIAANAADGYCDVYRIVKGENAWTATRVQRITLPELVSGQNRNRFCCVDKDYRYLYIEGTTSGTTGQFTDNDKHRFARYALPKLSEGDVTLSSSNKLFEFDIPCLDAYQGGAVVNGKYFEVDGYTHSSWLQQIDLNEGRVSTVINLWEMGICADGKDEPEASFVWNGELCLYTVYGHVYRLYFD